MALISLAFALCAGAIVWAVLVQREATEPIGEGDVFINDSTEAIELIADESDLDDGVRVARNELGIETVSVLDEGATVLASTSSNTVGHALSNQHLVSAVERRRFSALAVAVDRDVELDGIVEWPAGTVLYQVIHPIGEGTRSLLLYYDVAELLSRRTRPGELQPETLQLAGLGGLFGVFGIFAILGRGRTIRRYEAIDLEASLLRRHSAVLERANTELDEARERAEEALAFAEEKIRIRSEFVLMINHELRTPLTSVVTGAELIRTADIDDSEKAALLESMVRDGDRLLEIIDQILAVARIENRGLSRELSELPLDDLCGAVSATRLRGRNGGNGDVRVTTDTSALKLVLGSLVDNARTHGASHVEVVCSTESRITPALEVGVKPTEAVYLSVVDDGPGIDPAFLPRIFEKFEKSSFSSGTGLGLYMARMVIDALDGSMAVQTSPAGTTFEIALPATGVRTGEKVSA